MGLLRQHVGHLLCRRLLRGHHHQRHAAAGRQRRLLPASVLALQLPRIALSELLLVLLKEEVLLLREQHPLALLLRVDVRRQRFLCVRRHGTAPRACAIYRRVERERLILSPNEFVSAREKRGGRGSRKAERKRCVGSPAGVVCVRRGRTLRGTDAWIYALRGN